MTKKVSGRNIIQLRTKNNILISIYYSDKISVWIKNNIWFKLFVSPLKRTSIYKSLKRSIIVIYWQYCTKCQWQCIDEIPETWNWKKRYTTAFSYHFQLTWLKSGWIVYSHVAHFVCRPSVVFTFLSSPLMKPLPLPLGQYQYQYDYELILRNGTNILGWPPFKSMSNRSDFHPRWLSLLKIKPS